MKKTMKQHSFTAQLKSLAVVFGLALAFTSCTNDNLAQSGTMPTDDKGLTTFSTGAPTTRTTMDADGTFYWEAGDKIYVKDDDGNWNASSNAPTGKTASFKFMVPGKYTAHNSYEVYYPGKNGSNDQVTISAAQTQTEPNTTKHFGESGDCGMAKATRIGTNQQFSFTLDHKAAYLVFQPYTSNTILKKCYLTKIEVTSDNDIADTYTLNSTADTGAGALTGTGSGRLIELTTKGSGSYANGFPLTNNSASLTTNGAYMVIKPGTHTLRIRYWVKDNATNVEGTITKIIASHNFAKNEYVNITANLDVKNYDGDNYYMWDAQDQYWKGYEWTKHLPSGTGQPTLTGQPAGNYPQSNTDSRYYNEAFTYGADNKATHTSCKDLPNANEMSWYCLKGQPVWDDDELWTTMNHLYKGGMWFLKRDKISGYSKEHTYDGTDWRVTGKHENNNNPIRMRVFPIITISPAEANNYFYLPALGCYYNGTLNDIGEFGYFWSSSAYSKDGLYAYVFMFDKHSVYLVRDTKRILGARTDLWFK